MRLLDIPLCVAGETVMPTGTCQCRLSVTKLSQGAWVGGLLAAVHLLQGEWVTLPDCHRIARSFFGIAVALHGWRLREEKQS